MKVAHDAMWELTWLIQQESMNAHQWSYIVAIIILFIHPLIQDNSRIANTMHVDNTRVRLSVWTHQ